MATFSALSLSDPKYDEIAKRVREHFPNSCILWIDKVSNPELETEHQILYENIQKIRPTTDVKQVELFHGTNQYAANAICMDGFKKDLNKTSAYGKGTYFAKYASYSFEYSKKSTLKSEIVYMLLCSVIIGTTIIGTNNMEINTEIVDNTVDNMKIPTIVVTPYDKGGIPKYLIAFHKDPSI